MNYTQLIELIPSYLERQDVAFLTKLPTFIELAENRIATDMKQQGFQSVVTGTFDQQPTLAKPAFWRETISFSYKNAVGVTVTLGLRALEYTKAYWPAPLVQGQPRFYADYNISNFAIVPTPADKFEFELAYYARLQPLSEENQDNWLTVNAPQTLLYAALLEASLWTKSMDKIQLWQGQYDAATGSVLAENQERLADRNTVVTRA